MENKQDAITLAKKDPIYFIENILGVKVPGYTRAILEAYDKVKDKKFVGYGRGGVPIWVDKKQGT